MTTENQKSRLPSLKTYSRKSSRESLVKNITGVESNNSVALLASIRSGLKFSAISIFAKAINGTPKEVGELLSIPKWTLYRRKKNGYLNIHESDRLVRFARIKDVADDLVQGNREQAVRWLRAPLEILGNESPLEHSTTEMGAQDVEQLIGRLRHGVFS